MTTNVSRTLGEHAIIVGGGFGGLVTARVLADFFKRVTIIERDSISEIESTDIRKGVPQGGHIHILMSTGAKILRELFPDLGALLCKEGAYDIDILNEMWMNVLGMKPHFKSDKRTWAQSRPLLEKCIRSLVKNILNIEFLYSSEAQGLLSDFNTKSITGVRIKNTENNETSNIYADLVVENSGRSTQFPDWLAMLGYSKPEKTEVKVDLMYVSRIYRWSEDFHPDWRVLIIKQPPPSKKAGTVNVLENDKQGKRFIISLIGQHGEFPEATEAGFIEFAKQLPASDIYNIVKNSEALSPFYTFKFPSVRQFNYDKLKDIPAGFVALGDSVCSFSPIYGVGMSAALQCVKVLEKTLLREGDYRENIQKHFFKDIKGPLFLAWDVNVIPEYMFPELAEERPFITPYLGKYRKAVLRVADKNPDVWRRCMEIISLEKHPVNFIHPAILFRVIRQALKWK
jgi:2-polyprenyl-6-methoxyphenol hydroxylase-like FAD-dependent oxidoreductase